MKHQVKYLIMDIDGTMTDGKIYIGNTGEIFKCFDIKDGYGIYALLPANNIVPIVITGRESEIVAIRCKELNISEVYQGVKDKVGLIKKIVDTPQYIAYIGDDLNDIPAIEYVKEFGGVAACPANAIEAVRKIADYVCANNGGNGAIREFIEWLI